jgi:hypothetical protein
LLAALPEGEFMATYRLKLSAGEALLLFRIAVDLRVKREDALGLTAASKDEMVLTAKAVEVDVRKGFLEARFYGVVDLWLAELGYRSNSLDEVKQVQALRTRIEAKARSSIGR